MKILLLGYTGKVGCALKKVLADYELICMNTQNFNAENINKLKKTISEHKPDIIINTIAYLGIDKCKNNIMKSILINSTFPALLASICHELNITLIHFSTASVFNNRAGLFDEDDYPKPINVYGKTKLLGEEGIKISLDNHYIIRCPFIFGHHPKYNQLIETLLFSYKDIKVASDIYTTPTYNMDIAKQLKEIIDTKPYYGIYHLTNTGKTSLYELMNKLVDVFGFDKKVEPVSYKDFPHIDRKNLNSGLCTIKLKPMRHWKNTLEDFKDEMLTIQ